VRVLDQVQYFDIVELDVQVLVDRLQDTTDADVVLELNGDRLVGQSLEEAVTKNLSISIHITWACDWGNIIPKEKHGCGGQQSLEG
jgi:hypothetical protein